MARRFGFVMEVFRRRGRAALPAPEATGFDFDALARDLAQGLPRREVLRRVGLGAAWALLATLGLDGRTAAAKSGGGCPSGTYLYY